MTNLDQYLAALQGDAEGLASFENYEVENLIRRNPELAAALIKTRAAKGNGMLRPQAHTPSFAAQFDITIQRLTAAIAQDLDYVVYGVRNASNAFDGIVSLGTGTTLTVRYGANVDEKDRLKMSYVNGVNTDIVEIRCPQYAYPSMLDATLVDRFDINGIRYSISDTSLTDQFSKKFKTFENSMFGKIDFNALSVATFKNPEQFQAGIVDIPLTWDVNSQKGILGSIRQTASFTVTLSMFIQSYTKLK